MATRSGRFTQTREATYGDRFLRSASIDGASAPASGDDATSTAVSGPLLDVLLDSVEAAVAVVDRDLRVVLVNDRAASTIGAAVEGPMGRSIADLAPELAAALVGQIEAVLADGAARRNELVEARLADARRHSWTVDWLPIVDDVGAVEQVAVILRDRATQQRSEVGRALAEARLAIAEVAAGSRWAPTDVDARSLDDRLAPMGPALDGLFESSSAGLALLSLDGRVLRANIAFAGHFGRALVDVIGSPLAVLAPPGTGADVVDLHDPAPEPASWTTSRDDGTTSTTMRVTTWPLTDDDGRPLCALAVVVLDAAPPNVADGAPDPASAEPASARPPPPR